MTEIRNANFPLADLTEPIIRLGFEVYNRLGYGFLEIVYKEALEYEFVMNDILYRREKEYGVQYKDIILPHKFFADFVVFDQVILEIKTKECIANEDIAQVINYLKCSCCKVGLILNFSKKKVEIKRLVL